MKLHANNETGMSLIELLVAVAILAVALTPLLGIFLHGLRTAEKANKLTIAMSLARDMSEEIRSLPFWDPEISIKGGTAPNLKDTYFPAVLTNPQPFGYNATGEGDTTYSATSARGTQFDDVDDYDGWCRGPLCDCTGKPAGICVKDGDLEAAYPYDGAVFKYDGNAGRPKYAGFTQSVRVYNIALQHVLDEHEIDFNVPTIYTNTPSKKSFLFYDLHDMAKLRSMTTVFDPKDGKKLRSAKGATRLKVIEVNVNYSGTVASGVDYTDIGLAIMPVSQTRTN